MTRLIDEATPAVEKTAGVLEVLPMLASGAFCIAAIIRRRAGSTT